MRFAGFAEGARRLFIGLLTGIGFTAGTIAQTPAAPPADASSPSADTPAAQAQRWYQQGLLLLQAGQAAQAREAFARVIALDPSFAGAWLDLAVATYAGGDVAQTEEFLAILERRFAPLPWGVAQGMASLRERIAAGQADPGWRWRHALQLGGGHDSNANSGLSVQDLTLTLPGGAILLPLNTEFKPRADTHFLTHWSSEGQRRLGAGELELTGSLRARRNSREQAFDTSEMQLGVAYASAQPLRDGALPFLPGPWRVGLQWQMARIGEATALRMASLSALHAWNQTICNPQASVQLDLRRFPTARPLDSRVLWVGGQIHCPSPLTGGAERLKLQLRLGQETARVPASEPQGRPGGNTRLQEWTLSHEWAWAGPWGQHRLEALAQWTGGHDTEGYSPVLNDNERRMVRRTTLGAAYAMPLPDSGAQASRWSAVWTVQAYRQSSNLGIFQTRGEIVQLVVQRTW